MDDLREIIHTFDDEDRKEFKHFLNRVRQKNNRMDSALFDLLSGEKEFRSKEIMIRLYKKENKEAYYALRKRLSQQLTDFVILKSRTKDATSVAGILEYINLSQYLYDRKRKRLAEKYLRKARRLAEEVDHYELLNAIYHQMIDKFEWENEEELQQIISISKANKAKLEQEEQINLANSLIKHKLYEYQKNREQIDFDQLLSGVFNEFGISNKALLNPKTTYKLMGLIRGVIIAQKNFNAFGPYLIRKYKELDAAHSFSDRNVFYQMGLLYFIAHTLYRSKRFKEAKIYLDQFALLLSGIGSTYYFYYTPRYMQLKAAIHVFCNELDESQECLEILLNDKKLNLEPEERLNITINKGINFYLQGQIVEAHKVLMSIYHTDKWCEKVMGREWVMKKNLMEVILYYDMDKLDIAESRIRSIERSYRDFFKLPIYERVKTYLYLVKQFIMHPYEAKTEKFQQLVESTIYYMPSEQEDLQAMGFYAWLKSKMLGKSLYEVWVELALGE